MGNPHFYLKLRARAANRVGVGVHVRPLVVGGIQCFALQNILLSFFSLLFTFSTNPRPPGNITPDFFFFFLIVSENIWTHIIYVSEMIYRFGRKRNLIYYIRNQNVPWTAAAARNWGQTVYSVGQILGICSLKADGPVDCSSVNNGKAKLFRISLNNNTTRVPGVVKNIRYYYNVYEKTWKYLNRIINTCI